MAGNDEFDSDGFIHLPLDQTINSVRAVIVKPDLRDGLIDCELIHTSTDENYTAISYTWGSSIVDQFILLNSKIFSVKQNLWDFLDVARSQLSNEPLWIDAICCNQNDNAERTHQVQHMGEIFKSAKRVLAFLHPVEGLTTSLLDSVQKVYNQDTADLVRLDSHRKARLGSLLEAHGLAQNYVANVYDFTHPFVSEMKLLASHDYWTRMWCVQEVILAKQLFVMYESIIMPWHTVLNCVQDLLGTSEDEQVVFRRPVPKGFEMVFEHVDWYSIYASLNKINSFLLKRNEFTSADGNNVKVDITNLLWEFGDYACSDFRDRIFSLRSLAVEEIPVSYDYDFVDLYYALVECFEFDAPEMLTVQAFKALDLVPSDLLNAAKEIHTSEELGDINHGTHSPLRGNAFKLQQSSLAHHFLTSAQASTVMDLTSYKENEYYGTFRARVADPQDWDYYYACPICHMTIPRIFEMDAGHDIYICLASMAPGSHLVFLRSQHEEQDGFVVVHFVGTERISNGCHSLAR